MGQCPVIDISLKDVQGLDFKDAYNELATLICELTDKFIFLKDSPKLSLNDKKIFDKLNDLDYLQDINHLSDVKNSLKNLISYLYKHYDKQVILLIDEYDVPLAKSSLNG